MMREGIMIYNSIEQNWKIWIGQKEYETLDGMHFDIWIRNRYSKAWLGTDGNWFVTLEEDASFDLRVLEVYKIRILVDDLIPEFDVPF